MAGRYAGADELTLECLVEEPERPPRVCAHKGEIEHRQAKANDKHLRA